MRKRKNIEDWKQIKIPQFKGSYCVSENGKVKTIGRYLRSNGKWRPSKLMTPQIHTKGYARVNLSKDGFSKSFYVHRLVAMFFVANPDSKPCVNHLDGNKLNNHFSNLEWCTDAENNQHAKDMGLFEGSNSKIPKGQRKFIKENFFTVGRKKLAEMFGLTEEYVLTVAKVKIKGTDQRKKAIPIYKKVVDISTGVVYDSTEKVSELTGIKLKTLRRALSGERYNRTSFRYIVKGVIQQDVLLPPPPKIKIEKPKFIRPPKKEYIPHPKPLKKVFMFDVDGNQLRVFDSTKEACQFAQTTHETFRKAMKRGKDGFHKGYKFKFA